MEERGRPAGCSRDGGRPRVSPFSDALSLFASLIPFHLHFQSPPREERKKERRTLRERALKEGATVTWPPNVGEAAAPASASTIYRL